ncbi:MAG: pyridoxamine 5'-phosphate oxidase family protein [Anaerolineae bacterium]|jgi:general stress protein 26|nr:pyridoxamine 5'-phosphate oxidase family protein [Anaerolineae bacterium]
MAAQTLASIADDFIAGVHSEVWCNFATLDTQNRIRSRVLHPIWEKTADGVVGWIATGRTSLKAKHLAHNPHASLCYMKNPLKPIYIECRTEWIDDMNQKKRIWDLFVSTPQPLGYDLAPFFGSVDNPGYGLLQLTPWRIELGDLFGEARVWKR